MEIEFVNILFGFIIGMGLTWLLIEPGKLKIKINDLKKENQKLEEDITLLREVKQFERIFDLEKRVYRQESEIINLKNKEELYQEEIKALKDKLFERGDLKEE